MNINSIQASQVPQNAVRPFNKYNATAESRSVSIAGKVSTGAAVNELGIPREQVTGAGASLSGLLAQLDLILVHFPPFFPIAKYQRLDLIKSVNHVQEEIEKSNIDPSLKNIYSGEKLSEKAPDEEISTALDKLFQLRNAIAGRNPALPGMILNVKV